MTARQVPLARGSAEGGPKPVDTLGYSDRLVPTDYVPRLSDADRAELAEGPPEADPDRIPTYGELIMERPPLGPRLADVSLDLLALTADYPVGSPLRQAVAHYVSRLALQDGKIQRAVELLTSTAPAWGSEDSLVEQLLEILQR